MHPAHQRARKSEDAPRDSAGVHQPAGKDENRNGQKRKTVHAADGAVQEQHHGLARDQDIGQRGQAERDGNRHPQEHQAEQDGEEQQDHHDARPFSRRTSCHRITTMVIAMAASTTK